MSTTATAGNVGRVTQVIGSTFDVEFAEHKLPALYNALVVDQEVKGVKVKLTGEVQQHLGEDGARMEGEAAGLAVIDRGTEDVRRQKITGELHAAEQ